MIHQAHHRHSGDNICISQHEIVARAGNGNGNGQVLLWTDQLGSTDGDESLAGLEVDLEGNAILFGHTTGSLFRTKDIARECPG